MEREKEELKKENDALEKRIKKVQSKWTERRDRAKVDGRETERSAGERETCKP
jgi:hypothetical protein